MPLSGCSSPPKPSTAKDASTPIAKSVTHCAASQDPKLTDVRGPIDKGCGGIEWAVWFDLPSAAGKDGWIIQEIDVTYDVRKADGSVVFQKHYHFWEAWEVKAGKTMTTYQDGTSAVPDDNDDSYGDPSRPGTKGTSSTVGKAKFFEGPLPADFKTNNPNTVAGILHSSATKPPCWDGTGTDHNLDVAWDCTGVANTSSYSGKAGSSSFKSK